MCPWIEAWFVIMCTILKPVTMLEVPNACNKILLCENRELAVCAAGYSPPCRRKFRYTPCTSITVEIYDPSSIICLQRPSNDKGIASWPCPNIDRCTDLLPGAILTFRGENIINEVIRSFN